MGRLISARARRKAAFACVYVVFCLASILAQAASYGISIVASPGGTVQPEGKLSVTPDAPLELVAAAKPGYVFACWAVTMDSDIAIGDIRAARTSLHAHSDGIVEAIFVPRTRAGWTAIAIALPGIPLQVFTVPVGKPARLTISGYPARPTAGEWRFRGWKLLSGQASRITDPQTTPRLEAKGRAYITVEATQGPIVIQGGWLMVLDPKRID